MIKIVFGFCSWGFLVAVTVKSFHRLLGTLVLVLTVSFYQFSLTLL